MLASPVGPKIEAFVQTDSPAAILARTTVPIPDSLLAAIRLTSLVLPILVDERGRAALVDLPWFSPDDLPAPVVAVLVGSLPGWRFTPARIGGRPARSWIGISIHPGPR
jgi:hypothetical protein